MKKNAKEEDDSPPGGRALNRLRQFEIERGYEDADAVPSSQQGGEAQGEAAGESEQGGTGVGGGAASEAGADLADC